MARPGTPIKDVFAVMFATDNNVKEASQILKIKKSTIYNMKSQKKDQWTAMQQQLEKGELDLELYMKERGFARLAEEKRVREKSVKSGMVEKHVGVSRSIEGAKPTHVPKLKQTVTPASQTLKPKPHKPKEKQPMPTKTKDPYVIELETQNAKLKQNNREIAEALERSNQEKETIVEEHNALIDDFNKAKEQMKEMNDEIGELASFKNQLTKELEDTEAKLNERAVSVNGNHQPTGLHLVRLGKVYVSKSGNIIKSMVHAVSDDLEALSKVAEETGGELVEVALVNKEDMQ
jgi:chromosome segregation ATPase